MGVRCPVCHSGNHLMVVELKVNYGSDSFKAIECQNENCSFVGEPEELESE